jgi:CDP-glucose 4,6-dehydratase
MINFYKNKKILITGNTGFKGSWLTFALLEMGAKVIGYSNNFVSNPNLFKILNLEKKINFIKGDVRDFKHLLFIFNKYHPEFVFHLAAQSLVIESYNDPFKTFSSNVCGSYNLLECCRLSPSIKTLIYVTSDKCYDPKIFRKKGYKEEDILGGDDPYSSSKVAAENIFRSYYKSFFLNNIGAASVRSGNVIGGGDWSKNRLIPDCVRAIVLKKKLLLRNPNFVRPWQHVLEPIFGYLLLNMKLYFNNKKYSGSWNFGPSQYHFLSTNFIASHFMKKFNYKSKIIKQKKLLKKFKIKETKYLTINSKKSIKKLGWKHILNSLDAIKLTSDWYKEYYKKRNVENITKEHVRFFLRNYSFK